MSLATLKNWILGERFPHLLVLGICLGLLGLSVILTPAEPQNGLFKKTGVEQVHLGGLPLPEICIMKNATGFPCPGCGLSRSWISLFHGRFKDSFAHNRMGILVLAYVLLQVGRHLVWLIIPSQRTLVNRWGRKLDYGIIGVLGILVLNWAILMANMLHVI